MSSPSSQIVVEKSLTDYQQSLLKFVPVTVLQHLVDNHEKQNHFPQIQNMTTAILVAEIKNFYDQEYRLKHFLNDYDYNEYLAILSNRFLEIMSKTIHKYGGDIIQFLGNSLIAIWPRSPNSPFSPLKVLESDTSPKQQSNANNDNVDTDINIARKVTQCALDIKNESEKIISKDTEIIMGIGFGQCQVVHVGGVFKRAEYFPTGDALSNALKSLRLANSNHAVVACSVTWDLIKTYFIGEPIDITDCSEYGVKYLFGSGIRIRNNANIIRSSISDLKIKAIQAQIKTYIPAAFRPYLKMKRDIYGNEHRRVTMMVANLELQTVGMQAENYNLLQKVVEIIQQQIYRMEGSFNKVISYEGGIQVISSWGMSPLSHEDDAARAVFAAMNLKKAIYQFSLKYMKSDFDPPIHIGICTGNVFVGIVGNDGSSSKEVVFLGETVEKTYLMMQTASKHYGKIYVDYETKMEASQYIDFQFFEHIEFAHKLINYPIFSPIDPINDWWERPYEMKDALKIIRTHSNPFIIDYKNEQQHKLSDLFTHHQVVRQILEDIAIYASGPEGNVWTLAIKGPTGSGKSLFAKHLYLQTQQHESELLNLINETDRTPTNSEIRAGPSQVAFHFIASSCNAEIQKRFIGIWIPVLREILLLNSQFENKKKEFILNTYIKDSDVENKVAIIEEIFGVKKLHHYKQQLEIKEDPFSFVKTQRFSSEIEEELLFFLHEFMIDTITKIRNQTLVFLILDNVSMMDQASWKLFDLILSECENLIIVFCIQNQDSLIGTQGLGFKIEKEAQTYYNETILQREKEFFNVVEMDQLQEQELREILIEVSAPYEQQMHQEIVNMTLVLDQENSIKTYQGQKEIHSKLVRKYQVYDGFKDIEKEVVSAAIKKCYGNPHQAICLIYQLLINGYVYIRNQLLLATSKLRHCLQTNSWNYLLLPDSALKKNCQFLEKTIHSNSKTKNLSSELQVYAMLLLKAAAINGDIFSIKQLKSTFIFADFNTKSSLKLLLQELEERELVEMIYDDGEDDIYYRFNYPFLRETLCSIQLFEQQKKLIHEKAIEYLQENVIYDWTTDWNFEKETILLLQHLLQLEKVDSEEQLSSKSKQSLVIKKVNQALLQNVSVLKKGILYKKVKNPKKLYKERAVVLTQKNLEWYADEQLSKDQSKRLGYVQLDQIVTATIQKNKEVLIIKKQEAYSFKVMIDSIVKIKLQLHCTGYTKRGEAKNSNKKFIFSLSNKNECEQWVAYIEYLKTKVTYDQFVNKYGKVKFPLQEVKSITEHKKKQDLTPQGKFGINLQKTNNQIVQKQHQQQVQQDETLSFLKSKMSNNNNHNNNNYQRSQRKASNPFLNESNPQEEVEALKTKLSALYNMYTVQFFDHMQRNASKYNEEEDKEEAVVLTQINKDYNIQETLVQPIISFQRELSRVSNLEEDEINNEENIAEQIQEDDTQCFDIEESSPYERKNFSTFGKGLIQFIKLRRPIQDGSHQHKHKSIKIAANFQSDDTLQEINEEAYFNVAPIFYENTETLLVKVQIPLETYPFEEGKNHLEVKSEPNNLMLKQQNLRRRNKRFDKTPFHEIGQISKEEHVELVNSKNLKESASITKQQQKVHSALREKALALVKVLEQTHQPYNNWKRNQPKQKRQEILAEFEQKNKKSSSIDQEFMSQEHDKQSVYEHSTKKKVKVKTTKIYKPSPSVSELSNQTEIHQENKQRINESCNLSLASKLEEIPKKMKITGKHLTSQSMQQSELQSTVIMRKNTLISDLTNIQRNHIEGKEATIIKPNAQCILQAPPGQSNFHQDDEIEFKLTRGDVVTVEKELKQLNLVQCKITDKNKVSYSFVIPRDAIQIYDSDEDDHHQGAPKEDDDNDQIFNAPLDSNERRKESQLLKVLQSQFKPKHTASMSNLTVISDSSQNISSVERKETVKLESPYRQDDISDKGIYVRPFDSLPQHRHTEIHASPNKDRLFEQIPPITQKNISQKESSVSLKLLERREKRKQQSQKQEKEDNQQIATALIQEAVGAAFPGLKMQERKKKKQQSQQQQNE